MHTGRTGKAHTAEVIQGIGRQTIKFVRGHESLLWEMNRICTLARLVTQLTGIKARRDTQDSDVPDGLVYKAGCEPIGW